MMGEMEKDVEDDEKFGKKVMIPASESKTEAKNEI